MVLLFLSMEPQAGTHGAWSDLQVSQDKRFTYDGSRLGSRDRRMLHSPLSGYQQIYTSDIHVEAIVRQTLLDLTIRGRHHDLRQTKKTKGSTEVDLDPVNHGTPPLSGQMSWPGEQMHSIWTSNRISPAIGQKMAGEYVSFEEVSVPVDHDSMSFCGSLSLPPNSTLARAPWGGAALTGSMVSMSRVQYNRPHCTQYLKGY